MASPPLNIQQINQSHAAWKSCKDIRAQVFVIEQQVPVDLEWDAADATALHLLADWAAQPVACARVLPDGHIGRMAVLKAWRGQGIGTALLQQALQVCFTLQVTHARLSAQIHAVAFYQRSGFSICSEPYLDANIWHVDMQLHLASG